MTSWLLVHKETKLMVCSGALLHLAKSATPEFNATFLISPVSRGEEEEEEEPAVQCPRSEEETFSTVNTRCVPPGTQTHELQLTRLFVKVWRRSLLTFTLPQVGFCQCSFQIWFLLPADKV